MPWQRGGPLSTPERSTAEAIAQLVAASGKKIVVLDDDPTGTQTVHGIDVLTEWSEPTLARALTDPRACFYVLTNSRSLAAPAATKSMRELATNLRAAAARTGQRYVIVSRSDSTLRGHFWEEIDTLAQAHARSFDGVVVAPAFFEAGRVTANDVHWVRDGARFLPAAETEFARDATFGYRSSNLREWIQEKSHGAVPAERICAIELATLREPDGAGRVRDQLLALPRGSFVVVNATDYDELGVFVHGLLLAEATGRSYLYRTAASFVRVRAAIAPRPLLDAAQLQNATGSGGLVMVGSYTAKTTAQLEPVLRRPQVVSVELAVEKLATAAGRDAEIARVADEANNALGAGRTCVVFTSRALRTTLGRAGDLAVGETVSAALVAVLRAIRTAPRFLVAKGGITSSDLAVHGLDVHAARVLGQIEPGIPVWELAGESRFPGLAYIVFPGNVGNPSTLHEILDKLGG